MVRTKRGRAYVLPSFCLITYSSYPDVTVYCCGGVGGKLIDLEQSTTNDTNGDGVADQDTQVEPACETSNYNESA